MKRIFLMTAFVLAAVSLSAQTMPLERIVNTPFRTGNTAADTATLVPTQMSGLLTGTPTAAANYTTPTATQLCALFPFVGSNAANFHWDIYWKNTSGGANTITAVAGTGVTVVGTATVAQNAVKHWMVVLTGCVSGSAAAQLISLGSSTF